MPYERILLAAALQRYVHFPPVTLRQRELASVLARAFGAKIHVLTVQAPVPLVPHVESTEKKLARYAEPLVAEGLDVEVVFREGKPSPVIRELVEEIDADLVIIGSHSKRGPIDVGIGSTAAALERKLPATVMMIRPTPDEVAKAREEMIPTLPFVFPYG